MNRLFADNRVVWSYHNPGFRDTLKWDSTKAIGIEAAKKRGQQIAKAAGIPGATLLVSISEVGRVRRYPEQECFYGMMIIPLVNGFPLGEEHWGINIGVDHVT